jgi:hypothetical protein
MSYYRFGPINDTLIFSQANAGEQDLDFTYCHELIAPSDSINTQYFSYTMISKCFYDASHNYLAFVKRADTTNYCSSGFNMPMAQSVTNTNHPVVNVDFKTLRNYTNVSTWTEEFVVDAANIKFGLQ